MARNNLPPGLQGVNYTQWQSWKPVSIQGLTYYEIPGRPGFIFNPYGGGSQGEIARDPRQIEELVAEEEKANAPSQAGQLAGAGATLGGLYLGSKVVPGLFSGAKAAEAAATGVSAAQPAAAAVTETTLPGAFGVGNTAAAGTTAASTTGGASGATGLGLMGAVPYAGALGGALLVGKGAMDLSEGNNDKSIAGRASRGQLAITTGGLSEVAKAFGVGGSKDKSQRSRDSARSDLQGILGIGNDWNLKFGDGSGFDIGKDGGAMLENSGENVDGNRQRHYYDVDFSNSLAKNSVGRIQSLLGDRYGSDSKLGSDTVGMLVNAVTNRTNDEATVNNRISELENKFKANGIIGMSMPEDIKPQSHRSKTKSPGLGLDGKPYYNKK